MKDINYILEMIPHRYPFLLVDKVISKKEKKEIKTLKNVTINEPFFSGHFPHKPIMPGVLILESMAQSACLIIPDGSSAKTSKDIGFGETLLLNSLQAFKTSLTLSFDIIDGL